MARKPKQAQKSAMQLGSAESGSAAIPRARRLLLGSDKARQKETAQHLRGIRSLKAEYRESLAKLLGRRGKRELDEIRSGMTKRTRAHKNRQVRALLDDIGVDYRLIAALQKEYSDRARALNESLTGPLLNTRPDDPFCNSPWVTYTAPFGGYSWSYNWDRSSGPDDPDMDRHLDVATGMVGSEITSRLTDAGDNEHLTAEYYTGLNVRHTALAFGRLEVYLAFEFSASSYSGKVDDEYGFSSATYSQWAKARLTTLGTQTGGPISFDRLMFNMIDTDWGDGASWSNYIAPDRDRHWYRFLTTATFLQGESAFIEGGIQHMSWFVANDESVAMRSNMTMFLERIMVRSCGTGVYR